MILEHHRKCDPEGFSAKHRSDLMITVAQACTQGLGPENTVSDVPPQLKLLLDARVDPNVLGLLQVSSGALTELPLVLCALAAVEPLQRAAAPCAPLVRRTHTHPRPDSTQSVPARLTPALTLPRACRLHAPLKVVEALLAAGADPAPALSIAHQNIQPIYFMPSTENNSALQLRVSRLSFDSTGSRINAGQTAVLGH